MFELRHRREVDRAREGDRDARLDVEAVKRVEHGDVLAVGDPRRAVRLREVDAKPGDLGRVRRRVEIGGERLACRGRRERASRQHECERKSCKRGTED
jgi:hypothetical protein